MNLSGKSVSALANFYKIKPEEILVAHDELDLPPGVAKIKLGGGHGGHNGLKDIIKHLGNSQNFYRLRIGIGHPGSREKVVGWVLSKPPASDLSSIEQAIDEAERCLDIWLGDSLSNAQQRLHSFSAS
jgi:PTH1 family peptidyl-tRNA hydrolase